MVSAIESDAIRIRQCGSIKKMNNLSQAPIVFGSGLSGSGESHVEEYVAASLGNGILFEC